MTTRFALDSLRGIRVSPGRQRARTTRETREAAAPSLSPAEVERLGRAFFAELEAALAKEVGDGEWAAGLTEADKDESGHCHDDKGHWSGCDAPGALKPDGTKANTADDKLTADAGTPKKLADKESSQAWHEQSMGGWAKNVTDSEWKSLQHYQGSEYDSMNDCARIKDCRGDQAPHFAAIDAAIAKAELPEPVTAYRGVGPKLAKQLKVGTSFEDKAYVSTSTLHSVGESFGSDGAVLEINLPKGTKAASFPAMAERATGNKDMTMKEQELLLARGQKFRVTGERMHEKGYRVLTVELA